MSSQEKDSDKKHADGEDDVSESDETVEELLAIGNNSEQQDGLEHSDNEDLATRQKDKASPYMLVTNLPGVGTEAAFFSVTQTFPEGLLPLMPSTSLEDSSPDQNGGSHSSHQSGSLVTGRSDEEKTPVQNVCERSVQTPSPGMNVRLFLFERTHHGGNEKWYILYMIPENKIEVYVSICESFMDDVTSNQGYKTRQIPFAVDNARSQEFFTLYVQEQVTVLFEIQNRWQQNLVEQNARQELVFRVPNIHCESENRVAPGAKSHFRVEYIGGRGKLCQEQGKITLNVDSRVQYTLFFSIAIWAPD